MTTTNRPRRSPESAGPPPAEGSRHARPPAAAWISWVALALMTTGSVASLRPAPTMAGYGLAAVFLYLVPALVFLLPTSLVSAELASGWPAGSTTGSRSGSPSRPASWPSGASSR
ncbi:hypothetical protein [Amycolatopsis sp. Hca4]|uniref:hypothetical protein n=1 Tax=Amycolatopsis sp. Hca4 TaxID=2742131 RepID=UPI0020CAEB5A|nr:hypothetical protein [Amycolatopsis sp. Hca4]